MIENKKLDLITPKIMGILNITPDSFFDGGKFYSEKQIIKQTKKMLDQGAAFIDIGAYSSRPNAKHISETEELKRIVPIVKLLISEFKNINISIDTFRSKVAEACLKKGAFMINDISAGNLDHKMFNVIANYQVPYVLMHMKENPQIMQNKPIYNNLIKEIKDFFEEKINQLNKLNIKNIILDVGFGFGKTLNHNYEILKNLNEFNKFELPILAGMSRKSMLYNLLDSKADNMLNATSIVNTIALEKGAKMLRVHDVKEAVECIKIVEKIKSL